MQWLFTVCLRHTFQTEASCTAATVAVSDLHVGNSAHALPDQQVCRSTKGA
jgi:hypothetical protein